MQWVQKYNQIYVVKMATVNRMKKKKNQQPTINMQADTSPLPAVQKPHTPQIEKEYQQYYDLSQCNPIGITSTSTLFPHSQQMNRHYNLPHGFMLSPMLSLENQNCPYIEKTGDRIQRCGSCRAYNNCYNTHEINNKSKSFNCFICGRMNMLEKQLNKGSQNEELTSSIYQTLSPLNLYHTPATEDCFIFLVDISPDSYQCRMLYYLVSVIKEVLAREEFDDTIIYFYTYDEIVQEYDFSGEEIKCIIMDRTIENVPNTVDAPFLKDIREKLFDLLDSLEEISEKNLRRGSNFTDAFQFIKGTAVATKAKIFIFQSNQAIASEPAFLDMPPKNKPGNPQSQKSLLQPKNNEFLEKYAGVMLDNGISFSLFIFAKNHKNLKMFGDFAKLTASELLYYTKDSEPDLTKFYYDFSYLLGATYFKQVRIQYIIGNGYVFHGIYGNFYRIKEAGIVFKINYLEPSRKIFALIAPNPKAVNPLPYVTFQVNINYRYKRQDYMTVATATYPLTGYVDRLISSVDTQAVQALLVRTFLSSVRMQKVQEVKKRVVDAASGLWILLMQVYKKRQNFPDNIFTIVTTFLGAMKSYHVEIQMINNTPLLDRVMSERNLLQFCGTHQLANLFNPFLFDLTNLEDSMCREDVEFQYPYSVEPRFSNIKEGLFLLDSGISLYLFIAKKCDPNILMDVFGKNKITKNDTITEDTLSQVQSFKSSQIQVLIKTLRQQKSYGWAPLYIIRCGENSMNQRNFYMHFYMQKYEQFRGFKVSFEQFISMISKNTH